MGGQHHAQVTLPPGERPGTSCAGGWVGRRARQHGCGKISSPTGILSPDHHARRESLFRPIPLLEVTTHKIAQCIFNAGYTVASSGRPTLP